jgi:hypothetical protein
VARQTDVRPESVDLDNLSVYWDRVRELDNQARQAMQSWHTMHFTARFLDEGQTAGHRTYIGVDRLLNIAIDNQEAFESLITTRGVTLWAQWNLLRSVFEASFHVVWVLDPRDGAERRRRGLRLEILDSKSQKNWMDSLREAGLDEEALAAYQRKHAESTRIYHDEADALGLNWGLANQWLDVVAALPKLTYIRERFPGDTNKFLVCVWRRLAGFQHGFGYALLAGSDKGRSLTIPGGELVHITTNDQDLVNTCKMVSALHIAALDLVIQRNTFPA